MLGNQIYIKKFKVDEEIYIWPLWFCIFNVPSYLLIFTLAAIWRTCMEDKKAQTCGHSFIQFKHCWISSVASCEGWSHTWSIHKNPLHMNTGRACKHQRALFKMSLGNILIISSSKSLQKIFSVLNEKSETHTILFCLGNIKIPHKENHQGSVLGPFVNHWIAVSPQIAWTAILQLFYATYF